MCHGKVRDPRKTKKTSRRSKAPSVEIAEDKIKNEELTEQSREDDLKSEYKDLEQEVKDAEPEKVKMTTIQKKQVQRRQQLQH